MTINHILRPKGFGSKSCIGIAEKMRNPCEVLLNGSYEPVESNLLFRWGCTSGFTENGSTRQGEVNTSKAIKSVTDKRTSRMILAEVDLAPKTWISYPEWVEDHLIADDRKYVVRPDSHKQGKNLDLCEGIFEVYESFHKYENAYISEYIDKVKEFRVIVAQGRAVLCYEKIPEDASQIAWNHAQGATTPNTKWGQWDLNVIDTAIVSMDQFDLDFGAVDVMVDKDGGVYTLEINTAPETTSEYRQTCFAKVFDYMIDNGTDPIDIDYFGAESWKNYIHPAISDKAIV